MQTSQEILLKFISGRPSQLGSNPNPIVPGKTWCIGDSYTQEEKDQWKAEWDCFAVEHPDIMSLLPIRG